MRAFWRYATRWETFTSAMTRSRTFSVLQMPILEIVHCGANFKALCSAVVGLFLLTDEANTDVNAKRLIYELLDHVEDALLFCDIYWAVVDFVGQNVASGRLSFDKKEALETSDAQVISAVDAYRILLVMMKRIPHHWVHLSSETMARLLFSTLQLLTLCSADAESAETKLVRPINVLSLLDESADWFKVWLLKIPARDQLFVSLQESGFVPDLLQYLSRFRPLERLKSAHKVVDIVEQQTTQHVRPRSFRLILIDVADPVAAPQALCIVSYLPEFQDGRQMLYAWQRIPAHLQTKYRQTKWTHPDRIEMQCNPEENDRVYHLVNPIVLRKVCWSICAPSSRTLTLP